MVEISLDLGPTISQPWSNDKLTWVQRIDPNE